MSKTLYFPTIPLTPIDIANRSAAATGSPRYAMLSEHGDYNGHQVCVSFKPHSVRGPCWNAEYWWAGRCVLGRGSFAQCLRAALDEYRRGARGTTVNICLSSEAPESLDEQEQLAREAGAVDENPDSWYTGTHHAVSDAMSWERHGFRGLLQHALKFQGTKDEWDTTARSEALAAMRHVG